MVDRVVVECALLFVEAWLIGGCWCWLWLVDV